MSRAAGSWNLPKQLNELRRAEELPENLASHIYSLLLSVGDFTDVTSLKMTRKKKQTTTKKSKWWKHASLCEWSRWKFCYLTFSPLWNRAQAFFLTNTSSLRMIKGSVSPRTHPNSSRFDDESGFSFVSSLYMEPRRSSILSALARTPGCSSISAK